ncbi:hypothetical protein [Stenotrophomonas sp. GZD-301]|uniref:hypothetical protein n=1 Tax=Stenotrophomonas sp. GZD-301 TaxID=3404814 RepID=UPI003BB4FFCA
MPATAHQQAEFQFARESLARLWRSDARLAERWARYDLIREHLVRQWPADATRIDCMMLDWVCALRHPEPAADATATVRADPNCAK